MPRRILTLVRHAKSSWRFGDVDDRQRPLNSRGMNDCRRVPKALAERILPPDLIVTSDATRTLQTTESLARAFDLGRHCVVVEPELYLASPVTMRKVVVRHAADSDHVAVVGHNPGTTDLFNWLTGEYLDNMPTFGVAHLELKSGDWANLAGAKAGGSARVLDLIFPKQL